MPNSAHRSKVGASGGDIYQTKEIAGLCLVFLWFLNIPAGGSGPKHRRDGAECPPRCGRTPNPSINLRQRRSAGSLWFSGNLRSGRSGCGVARLTGLEPATPGVTGRYSNQLSYNPASQHRTKARTWGGITQANRRRQARRVLYFSSDHRCLDASRSKGDIALCSPCPCLNQTGFRIARSCHIHAG